MQIMERLKKLVVISISSHVAWMARVCEIVHRHNFVAQFRAEVPQNRGTGLDVEDVL